MVGLSIVLESNNSPLVISKVSISSPSSGSSHHYSNSPTASNFLDVCSLCKKKLFPGQEIYMYQGDRAFCSSECRSIQIVMDAERTSVCRIFTRTQGSMALGGSLVTHNSASEGMTTFNNTAREVGLHRAALAIGEPLNQKTDQARYATYLRVRSSSYAGKVGGILFATAKFKNHKITRGCKQHFC